MKKNILFATILMMTVAIFACNKKSNTTTPATPTTTACNGMNLCFDLDGTNESHNATWKVLTNRNRIYWEEGSGNTYKNIELDVYGTTTGVYNITANPKAGEAGFQYFITNGNKNIQGQSGTVEVTAINGTQITGKFTITASDGTKTYQITNGQFVNVPQ
ncbi:MAG: DUF6252 family protein [Flavipsychrobacter sp.]